MRVALDTSILAYAEGTNDTAKALDLVAADAGCRLLLSEDLQDGFTWRGVTVVNPFAPSPHPLLGTLLA